MKRAVVSVVSAAVGLASAGCAGAPAPPASPAPTVTRTVRTTPTHTVIRSGPVLRAGQGTTFTAQAGVALRISVSKARAATGRLSPSYGYPPQHGWYVTLQVTITNIGRKPVDIGPLEFYARIRHQGRVTVNDGNAPYSGASAELDNTELDPGQVDRGPLTFDVVRPHGRLVFAPDRSPAITWRF